MASDATPSPTVLAQAIEALKRIADLKPTAFEIPANWREQIAACPECQRYKGHPIQMGICDTHHRPLWDREKHDAHEEVAIGYRAREIARASLEAATQAPQPAAEADAILRELVAADVPIPYAEHGQQAQTNWAIRLYAAKDRARTYCEGTAAPQPAAEAALNLTGDEARNIAAECGAEEYMLGQHPPKLIVEFTPDQLTAFVGRIAKNTAPQPAAEADAILSLTDGGKLAAPTIERKLSDHVEQRLLTWRQRHMNRCGDCLALDDFMNAESLADLIDFVCDESAIRALGVQPTDMAELRRQCEIDRELDALACAATDGVQPTERPSKEWYAEKIADTQAAEDAAGGVLAAGAHGVSPSGSQTTSPDDAPTAPKGTP